MKTWQERGIPYYGYDYDATTPHYFWDGATHYWTGMAVKGAEDQDTENPACCHDVDGFLAREVKPDETSLKRLRSTLKDKGFTHVSLSRRVGMGISGLRERLYGRRALKCGDFQTLCRLAGIDPVALGRKGEDEG